MSPAQAILWSKKNGAPSAEKLAPVGLGDVRDKPRSGGLWTSSLLDGPYPSDWARWCAQNSYGCGVEQELYVLTPDPDASIYEIDSYDDLARLHVDYGVGKSERLYTAFAWACVALDYDGVRLTERGNCETHLPMRTDWTLDTYAWDAESTVWFRWMFTEVEHRGTVKIEEHDWSSEMEDA